MSLARSSTAYDSSPSDPGFFEREKDRLIEEISTNFEELMAHTNILNRKLEEVHGVGKEFTTVGELWGQFNALIRAQQNTNAGDTGMAGTGGANFGQSTNQPQT